MNSDLAFAAADRYLHIVRWARRRYTRDGWLELSRGLKPSIYSRIEAAAFRRYMATPG